jgi:hypothetical protein
MRNLIVIAKVCLSVDPVVDALIERLSSARDLNDLMASTQSGRGLLHWASYYDPWLMGDDLDLQGLHLQTQPVAEGVVEISLVDQAWAKVQEAISERHQWAEQDWLIWHLWQAFGAFRDSNAAARLFFGREVLGASLDDSDVLGRHIANS